MPENGSVPERRITIRLTQGGLNNNYVSHASALQDHPGFFPDAAIGEPNARAGKGRLLTVHFAGAPEPVKTDIPRDYKSFRCRAAWGRFFERHHAVAGDSVTIERLSEDEYRVDPAR
jgi:hypothetical protein